MIPKKIAVIIFIAATIDYIFGLLVTVMDVDAAQYASMSREMFVNSHFFQVLNNGENYLDKPPLIFWITSLSFKIFGVSGFAYKLPSFLFTLIGVYSTFKLAKFLYNENVGWIASLILYTCQAFFLFNNDVRTDTVLTACVIFSCWQLILFSENKNFINLALGFAGIAFAMLAKGPIGAVVPASALFAQFIFKRNWKAFFHWQWFAGIIITLILLLPMVIGLYNQYGIEGPKFFFWTQSFGRITGENVWKNETGYFYFTHVFLWAFLPWSLVAVIALIKYFIELFKKRFKPDSLSEVYTIGGFLLPLIALSLSHYKLPHYVFVVFPLCAIFTAAFLERKIADEKKSKAWLVYLQAFVSFAMLSSIAIIISMWFTNANILLWIILCASVLFVLYLIFKGKNKAQKIVYPSFIAALTVNLILNAHVYPSLLNYQSGSQLATKANAEKINEPFFYYGNYQSYAFGFYAQRVMRNIGIEEIRKYKSEGKSIWVVGDEEVLKMAERNHLKIQKIYFADDYHITTLTLKFLDPQSRPQTLRKIYLIQI
ncbi:MAG: glycosyltransferase family 39 protein [Chitinophagales bacterium]|nr:glycosyltransferase family 39 protein [Chitinophagales bacterium]